MTSEEIKAAIERLNALDCGCGGTVWVYDVADAFMSTDMLGPYNTIELRNKLVVLLEQVDSDSYAPVDADGVPIRIGDRVDVTENVRGLTVIGIGTSSTDDSDMGVFVRDDDGYTWFNARFLHHYHKPTIEDMLREFALEWSDVDDDSNLVAEYADRLKELIQDER